MRISPIKLLYGLLYAAPVSLLTLAACGGGASPPPAQQYSGAYTVGGNVTGLASDGLVLRLNGGNDLTVASGVANYVFSASIINGSSYSVTVLTHPSAPPQVCTLAAAASGVMPSANVINADVNCVNAYKIGVTISGAASGVGPILQNNGGDNLFIPAITPTPASYVFNVPVASGANYTVTQLSRARAPAQDCAISPPSNFVASGVVAGADVDVTISCVSSPAPDPKFAYVTNSASSTVSAYTIDVAASGVLTSAASAVPAGDGPYSLAVEPSGRFAYAVNSNSDSVSAYSIDPASGVLAAIDANGAVGYQTSIATGDNPKFIAVHPSAKFAYVVNQGDGVATAPTGNSISAYSIDITTGALSAIDADGTAGTQTTIATGNWPYAIAIDPLGRFAYVANSGNSPGVPTGLGDITAYKINETTGALTLVDCVVVGGNCSGGSNFLAGDNPQSVTVDPTGRFVYVANSGSRDVSSFDIDQNTGALALTAGSPMLAGLAPRSLAVDPNTGLYLYVANAGSNDISVYDIDPVTGDLNEILASPFSVGPTGTLPISISIDPSSQFLYVANFVSNNVSVFVIDLTDGSLIEAVGSPFAAGAGPTSVTITQ